MHQNLSGSTNDGSRSSLRKSSAYVLAMAQLDQLVFSRRVAECSAAQASGGASEARGADCAAQVVHTPHGNHGDNLSLSGVGGKNV